MKVKFTEVSENLKFSKKATIRNLNVMKTHKILQRKAVIKHTVNGSMKRKLQTNGKEDDNEIVWECSVSARTRKTPIAGTK